MLEIYPRFESEMREIRECFYLEGYKTIYEVMQKKHNEFMQINFSESLEILGYTERILIGNNGYKILMQASLLRYSLKIAYDIL